METTKEGSPLLTNDELIERYHFNDGGIQQTLVDIRDFYELDRKGKQAEIDGLRERNAALTKALGVAEGALEKARAHQDTLRLIMSGRTKEQEDFVEQGMKQTDAARSAIKQLDNTEPR